VCGEVHHRIDIVLAKEVLEQFGIASIADNELARRYSRLEAGGQVIERNDALARLAELSDDVAADVAGATSDQYLLVIHKVF
jgi:hypothetical protein